MYPESSTYTETDRFRGRTPSTRRPTVGTNLDPGSGDEAVGTSDVIREGVGDDVGSKTSTKDERDDGVRRGLRDSSQTRHPLFLSVTFLFSCLTIELYSRSGCQVLT